MNEGDKPLSPPIQSISNRLAELITPAVIIAFISGAATVIAAYFAASGHIDKTICGINSSQMRDTMQKVTLYQLASGGYLADVSNLLNSLVFERNNKAQENFSKLQTKKINAAVQQNKLMPMPYQPIYSAEDIIEIMYPLTQPLDIPSSSEATEKSRAAIDSLATLYALCPK